MTEYTFEYRALRFLNDRFELYDISDHDIKTALFDIPQNEYDEGMALLRKVGHIKNKDLYDKGLSITSQGQVRLQQLQRLVDNEKEVSKTYQKKTPASATGIGKYFLVHGKSYNIGTGTFWVALPLICTFAFFLGTVKYDAEKISLADQKKALEDTVKLRDNKISQMRHFSDSALNILSHMPYGEMTLDTHSFRKVQTTIEDAGAVLYLIK